MIRLMTGRCVFLTVALFLTTGLHAQNDDEGWLMELGGGIGGSFYMGDANSRLYRNTDGSGMFMVRYNFNPRFSVKGIMQASGISGSMEGALGQYPQRDIPEFNRTVYAFSVQAEWGFLGYTASEWMGGSRLAPYGMAGLGFDFIPAPATNDFALDMPLGLGVRYKLAPRVNIGLEWCMHFTSSDRLDVGKGAGRGFEDPAMIAGKGLKNKDSYCCTMFYVTFDVFKRPCDCNDEKR